MTDEPQTGPGAPEEPLLERLFQNARRLPPEQRSAYLAEACDGAPHLRRQLERLLAADDALARADPEGRAGVRGGFLDSMDPVAAAALLDSVAPEPEAVGRYRVERRLGHGGMGVVYLGRDPTLDRPVALKLLPSWLAGDRGAARNLTREARAASALDHPNIGTIYEVGETAEGRPYIAMAYYEGETLRERMAGGPLPAPDAGHIAAQVAAGLGAAHARGVVHRDVKPENVILTRDGLAKVLDFGVATMATAEATRTGRPVGTVAYMSPEQTRGEAVDERSDVWSLGVVLYEMLAGRRPFPADHRVALHAIRHDPHPPLETASAAAPALAAVVERCLRKSPEERFPDMASLGTALREAVGETTADQLPRGQGGGGGNRPLWGPVLGYAATATIAQTAVTVVAPAVGAPGWLSPATLAVLVLGLPLVLLTAASTRPGTRLLGGLSAEPAPRLALRLTWRRLGAAGALALGLIVLAAGTHAGLRTLGVGPLGTLTARGLIQDRDPIVLADFGVGAPGGSDSTDVRTARVVTEAVRIDLMQSPALRLAEAGEVADALRRMGRDPAGALTEAVARELALREGLKAVITGSVARLGGRYVLTARVVGIDGVTLTAVRETARDSTGLIDAVDRLSKSLRERIGEPLRALNAAAPLPRVTTTSLPALRRYAEAQRLARVGGDDARLAALLQEAVSLDTTFAAAYRGLATTYWNMRADRSQVVAATIRAYQLRDRMPSEERGLIEASYHWQVRGDPAATAEAYRAVLARAPENVVARSNLALALLFQGEPAEAERVLRPGLQPGAPAALPLNLARSLYFQGRSPEALAVLDSMDADAPSPATALVRVRILGATQRHAAADAVASRLLDRYGVDPQVRAEALRARWHLLLTRGRLREAEALYPEVVTALERAGSLDGLARLVAQRAEAQITLLGRPGDARATLAGLMGRSDLDVLTVGATTAPRVAAALALAGDTAAALDLAARWEALPPEERSDPDHYSPELARARVDLEAGLVADAARRLEEPASATIQGIHYLPDYARALQEAGRLEAAVEVLKGYLDFRHTRRMHRDPAQLGPALLRLADLHELTGDTASALAVHGRLVELWEDADAPLRQHVDHARQRMAALAGPENR